VILPRESFGKWPTHAAIKIHNIFEKQDSIFRDAMYHKLSLDTLLVWNYCVFGQRKRYFALSQEEGGSSRHFGCYAL
jgi:hypothetical protein